MSPKSRVSQNDYDNQNTGLTHQTLPGRWYNHKNTGLTHQTLPGCWFEFCSSASRVGCVRLGRQSQRQDATAAAHLCTQTTSSFLHMCILLHNDDYIQPPTACHKPQMTTFRYRQHATSHKLHPGAAFRANLARICQQQTYRMS